MGGVQHEHFPAQHLQVCVIFYSLRCIADKLLWGRGSAVSVTCCSVRLYLTKFLNTVDNKLCLASRSSHLTFSKDQDKNFIPLVCHGSLPLFVRSHWDCAGFEYFANPQSRSNGFITWQMDGQPTVKMGAGAVGPDQGSDGSGVGARLIPEEPMVRPYHSFA